MIYEFPPLESADETGLLAVGGDLEVESLLLAYRSGIFPWPIVGWDVLPWFSPPERALLFLDELRIPQRLEQRRRTSGFEFRIDTAFEDVIQGCAGSPNRKRGRETWITPELSAAYIALHHAGYGHSVECFLENRLVGGLYGVSIGKMFAGESMFYTEPDASKLAFVHLAEYLRERGAKWLDCQQQSPLFEQFGARLVARDEYIHLLSEAVADPQGLF